MATQVLRAAETHATGRRRLREVWGDTMAIPLLQQATVLRNLGVPHIALRKMVSGAIVAAFVAVPLAVLFAVLLAPFGAMITMAAPWIFIAAAAIAYFSAGRWASVAALLPFVLVIVALQGLTAKSGVKLSISYFLGIAIGPQVADLFSVLSPADRTRTSRDRVRTFALAPYVKAWGGYFPNPLKVLDGPQTTWTLAAAAVSSATFVFSPVATTVLLGEIVGSRVKHAYQRLTTVLTARSAAASVSRRLSHEAIIATFVGLILVIGVWEGGVLGLLMVVTMGLLGGLLYRPLGFNTGVRFMGYYTAVLTVPELTKLLGA